MPQDVESKILSRERRLASALSKSNEADKLATKAPESNPQEATSTKKKARTAKE